VKDAPLEPEYALQALEDADDREQILDVLWRAARSRLTYAALLSVHASDIRARRGADRAWRVPRAAVPVFEAAIASRAPAVSAIASGEPFVDGMLGQLGGAAPAALVLPIAIGGRTIALVVGHRGAEPLTMADVSDLVPLANAASPAFERVLKTRAKATVRPESEPGYEIEVIIPTSRKLDELRAKQSWQELADALRTRVAEGVETGDPDDEEQLELLVELGRIESEHLGRADHAIEAWRSVRTIDAGDRRALEALEALFVQHARWADAADLHEQRVALAEEPGERIAHLLELAAIAAERLDDPERAVAAYERVLHWEPQHSIATRELEQLYSARQQWEPLAALLLDRGALEDVARMYDDKLGDTRAAFLVWLAVMRADREHATALDELARLGAALPADEIIDEGRALAEELDTGAIWQLVAEWGEPQGASTRPRTRSIARAGPRPIRPGAPSSPPISASSTSRSATHRARSPHTSKRVPTSRNRRARCRRCIASTARPNSGRSSPR
jgi:tetratricopeptide (TPR) repeat protein